jgi:capsular exopolysaccharide synthesis family protein
MGRIEEALRKAKVGRQDEPSESATTKSQRQPSLLQQKNDSSLRTSVLRVPAGQISRSDEEELSEERVIASSVHDERAGPYRQLRTRILKTMRDNQWTTLAITSAHVGAGKSLTSTNLAISFSRAPNTAVLLVDLDLETPTIHEKLNLKPEKGLVDFLEDKAELEDIMFDPGLNQLTVLAGRPSGRYSSELLASSKMQKLMHDLCYQSDASITIFDLPPLLRNDDALLFAPNVDATLLIVEDGVTTKDQLQQSIELLDKANIIGTILNKARE